MQGMSDKELDEFFRKMAENYDIPYNPKAWGKMRPKLEITGGLSGGFTRKIISGIALLILLGTVTLWYVRSQQAPTRVEETSTLPAPAPKDETEQTPEVFDPLADQQVAQNPTRKESKISNAPDSRNPDRPSLSDAGSDHSSSTDISRSVAPALKESSQSPDPVQKLNGLPQTANVQHQKTGTMTFLAEEEDKTSFATALLPSQPWTVLPASWQLPETVIKHETMVVRETEEPAEAGKTPIVAPEKPAFHRFGLSFMVSPDLSALHMSEISQVGTKGGIGLEVFVFRNLSLNTGVILSHKVYSATGGYEPAPGFWNYRTKPVSINAACQVLDIPLNLRYYAFNREKSRVFLSSGLSSYLMLKEDYEYEYKVYDPYQYNWHSARNKNHHYFKVFNFSLGYERAIGRRWALQAEPFIKVPLAGVGEGNVKLSTAGMFFTIKYTIKP